MTFGPFPFGAAAVSRFKALAFSILAVFGVCFCLLLVPCVQKVPDGEGWVRSRASLRGVTYALLAYHDIYKRLPPAAVTDKKGRPLYSWRVLLLPYLEEKGLYQQFQLDEPWDSPHNKKLVEKTPRCYQPFLGGEEGPGLTRYQVCVGPGTAFERPGLRLSPQDFPDGLADTLLVVEGGEAVPWSKPADLAYDPNGPLPSLGGAFDKPVHFLCYEVGRNPGFNAAFADGTARFLARDIDERTLRGLITRNGGEKVELSGLE
jgi:hypothetical protein